MLERRRNGKIGLSKFCLTFGEKRLSKYSHLVLKLRLHHIHYSSQWLIFNSQLYLSVNS